MARGRLNQLSNFQDDRSRPLVITIGNDQIVLTPQSLQDHLTTAQIIFYLANAIANSTP